MRGDREGRLLDARCERHRHILEAADDVTVTALALSVGVLGNVRTQMLRAFSAADMKGIIGKMV
jgi:uncharacterized protein with GYD domain